MKLEDCKPGVLVMVVNADRARGYGAEVANGERGAVLNVGNIDECPVKVHFPDQDDYWWLHPDDIVEVGPVTDRIEFEGGGMRDAQTGKPRFDLLFPLDQPYDDQLLTRLAIHMAKGAEKYEDRNWEKFSDQEAYDRAKASAARHFVQWFTGETDEDHAAAVVFNLMAAEYVKGKLGE